MYMPNFLDGFDRLVAFDAETTGKRTGGHRVAGVDRDGILLISPNGARFRICRVEPDEHAAVAWSIRAGE
jgi:hypothetical protein